MELPNCCRLDISSIFSIFIYYEGHSPLCSAKKGGSPKGGGKEKEGTVIKVSLHTSSILLPFYEMAAGSHAEKKEGY